jgi:hypothetical protein
MKDAVWEMTHSVEASVSAEFAWNYWTDGGTGVANWDDPPAEFELDGPFAAGGRGRTRIPGSPPIEWLIRDCIAPEGATIEMQLGNATLSFEWRFEAIGAERTRLTQRVALRGEKAGDYVEQVQKAFGVTLEAGMKRIADLLEQAAARAKQEPH